jgi:GGDEF domain-containing protein
MRSMIKDYQYRQEIAPEQFAHMTDWLLAWQQRNPAFGFSLVMIEFTDTTALGDALGAAYAHDLIKRIGREIADVLRTTDLFCRIRAASYLVLLPQGAPEIVLNKLEPILAAARHDGLDASHLHIAKLVVPQDRGPDDTAVGLIERMAHRPS